MSFRIASYIFFQPFALPNPKAPIVENDTSNFFIGLPPVYVGFPSFISQVPPTSNTSFTDSRNPLSVLTIVSKNSAPYKAPVPTVALAVPLNTLLSVILFCIGVKTPCNRGLLVPSNALVITLPAYPPTPKAKPIAPDIPSPLPDTSCSDNTPVDLNTKASCAPALTKPIANLAYGLFDLICAPRVSTCMFFNAPVRLRAFLVIAISAISGIIAPTADIPSSSILSSARCLSLSVTFKPASSLAET